MTWWLNYREEEINGWARKLYYRRLYLPITPGVQHVEFGNADSAETAIKNPIAVGETVAAMIVEPIQGEAYSSGVTPEVWYWGLCLSNEIFVALISSGR